MPPSLREWVVNGDGGSIVRREEKARREWDFHLCTVISPLLAGDRDSCPDALGAVEFDSSDRLLATGGISRKIRIYTRESLLPREGEGTRFTDHPSACSFYMCTPAKLSSLRWKPDSGSRVVAAGDYDGVVTEYDLEKRVSVFERDEHGGRKVWSVDYSHLSPQLAASASDDGSAHLWDSRCPSPSSTAAKLFPGVSRSPVCCVEFDPRGGPPLLGLGSADRRAYVYDLRVPSVPASVLHGHRRTVTYVRFVGGGRILTASTDGHIKMWDSAGTNEIRTYEGHENKKCFVGLSAWGNGGLLGCGSETNEVFVYDMRWGDPIWVQGLEGGGGRGAFVSGVCWRQTGDDGCMLVAGGSNGVLQVSVGNRKTPPS